jgi:hypothetical protein
MRPLFSGAHRAAPGDEERYFDQRADFFAATILNKRPSFFHAMNYTDFLAAGDPVALAPSVEEFANQVGRYHRDINGEADLRNPHSVALIKVAGSSERVKQLFTRLFRIVQTGAGGAAISLDQYNVMADAAKATLYTLRIVNDGFVDWVNSHINGDATIRDGLAVAYAAGYGSVDAYNAPNRLVLFPTNMGKLFMRSEKGAVVDPELSLIFAESADPEVWVRNSEGKVVDAETGAVAGIIPPSDACVGTKVADGADGLTCTNYVTDCLMGQNIDACRDYFASADFYNNTIEEVQKMDPLVAVKMLRKFGFKEVSEYDSDRKMNIVTIEPVAKWIEGLTGMADAATITAISGNEQLKQYLGWIIQLVNRNPAILNPGYRGDLNADSHDPNRFAYTGFAKMGIKARRPVRNSCYRDIDAIANAIDQHNITLGIRLNAPIVGGIVPAKVMIGGSYATISQAETSIAQLKSNRRNTSEILSKTFEYLTNKLQAFHKGISAKDSNKINELINDLAKKEDKLYEVIDFVEKYALLVDVLGEKAVSEVVTVDQMRKAVQARSKLFAKKVKRETDIVSVLRSLTGAVEQETPAGHGHPAGTAAGI